MKKFELNVVNFNNEDVIATSVELTVESHYTVAAGDHFHVYEGDTMLDGVAIEVGGEIFKIGNGTGETGCEYKLRDESGTAIDGNNYPGYDYYVVSGLIDGMYDYKDGVYTSTK